ncbi:MAG: RHS repeat-associated core domain-containing protein [Candidatus Accumulibacter sp. UW26]
MGSAHRGRRKAAEQAEKLGEQNRHEIRPTKGGTMTSQNNRSWRKPGSGLCRTVTLRFAAIAIGMATVAQLASAGITEISPRYGRVDVLQTFVATGTSMAAVSIDNCTPDGSPAISATQVTFRCTPRLPGAQAVSMGGVPASGIAVMVGNAIRQGNAASRGIPSVNGVSLWNGNFFHEVADMSVPGKGPTFILSRSYNSYYWSYEAQRGGVDNYKPWRFNWDLGIGYTPNSNKKQLFVQMPDGSGANFFKDSDGNWYPVDQASVDVLKPNVPVAGQTTLFTRGGLRYVFQNPAGAITGKLLIVGDRDGNNLKLTYGVNGKVSRVTDASGRNYTFDYELPTADRPGNTRLKSVTDVMMRSVQYTWDVDVLPGGEVRERIKTVRDVRGNVTTYNYRTYVSADIGSRIFLASIVDPRKKMAVRITYSDQVYGNWGVASVANALGNTWSFKFCAEPDPLCKDTAKAERFVTTVTPPTGGNRVVRFNPAGRPFESADGLGNLTRAEPYATATLPIRQQNLAGLTTKQQSALNNATQYLYDPETANLKTRTDANGKLHQQTWSSNAAINLHAVATSTTPENLVSGYQYTPTGNLIRHTLPSGGFSELTYKLPNLPGFADSVTDPRGKTTRMTYDAFGYLASETGPLGEVSQHRYDLIGRRIQTIDARGGVTTTTYDAAGLVLTVTDPMGRKTTNTYDANGNLVTRTDPRTQVTTYRYDDANRLDKVSTTIAGQTIETSTIYDLAGRVIATINANKHRDSTTYDATGNVVARANALTFTTTYAYDADNRVIAVTDPEGRRTETTYDPVGRVTSVRTPAGTRSTTYDGDGRVIKFIDAAGRQTLYGYYPPGHPAAGHLATVTDALGAVTQAAEYDLAGNVKRIIDPAGHSTSFTYDARNRLLRRTDAKGQVWSTGYDLAGNVIRREAPGGLVTTYTYDLVNQLLTETLPDNRVLTYTYDANGNRVSMTDDTGTTRYKYDRANRLSLVIDPRNKQVSYTYDPAGNRIALGYPNGKTVAYGFDAGERLTSVTDWLGKTSTYALNKAGQVVAINYANGSRATMAYDTSGRLTDLANLQNGDTAISNHKLTLDGNGNITTATAQLPLLPTFAASTRTMSYNAANRLATVDGVAVSHDPAGRITGLAGNSYAYDGRDLMTAISGATSASFSYNGAGHRVARTLAGVTTRYVIDPNAELPNVVTETDASGVDQRSYIYGYGLLEQITAANVPSWYHFDPTGHTLALTNAAGTVSDRYAYTPYGDTTASGTTVNPFRFVGKYGVMDDGNGMQYMRARYYRPDVARFMSLDALPGNVKEPQGLNRYAYVRGNPVLKVDPLGMSPVPVFSWGDNGCSGLVGSMECRLSAYSFLTDPMHPILKVDFSIAQGPEVGYKAFTQDGGLGSNLEGTLSFVPTRVSAIPNADWVLSATVGVEASGQVGGYAKAIQSDGTLLDAKYGPCGGINVVIDVEILGVRYIVTPELRSGACINGKAGWVDQNGYSGVNLDGVLTLGKGGGGSIQVLINKSSPTYSKVLENFGASIYDFFH